MTYFFKTLLIFTFINFLAESAQANSLKLQVTSNVRDASFLVDSILAGQIKDGKPGELDVRKGWNDITVTSKGYLSKKFKVFIGNRGPYSLYFAMHKLPSPDTKDQISPKVFGDEKKTPLKVVASCNQINAITSTSQRTKLSCKELSLAAEIQSTGPHISNQAALKKPSQKIIIEKFVDATLGPYSENWNVIGERLHHIVEEEVEGYEAAAWSALFGGDCNRVSELYEYMRVTAKFSPAVWLFQSVCYELHGDNKTAAQILDSAMLEKNVDTNSSAAVFYHKARLQIPTSVDQSLQTLNACMAKFPWYQKCYLMASDLELAKGNLKKHLNLKAKFKVNAQRIIGPKIDLAIASAGKRAYEDALMHLNSLGFYSRSFSAAWMRVLVEYSMNKSPKLSSISGAMFSNVFAPSAAAKVLKVIEKGDNKAYFEKSLKILIRDLPKNAYFLWKLSGHYLSEGRCQDVIGLKMPIFKMKPKQEAALLEHKSRCYVNNKDFESATEVLKKMTRLIPTEWKAHYQLANVYFKSKAKFKAVSAYRETISLKPPKEYLKIIQDRLDEIGANEEGDK